MQSTFINNNIVELQSYLTKITADYHRFQDRHTGTTENSHKVKDDMFDAFCDGLTYKVGKKYCKVITKGSVHSFIVLEDNSKFKAGDILKAKSWAAPATNFARGNILDLDNMNVCWAGL